MLCSHPQVLAVAPGPAACPLPSDTQPLSARSPWDGVSGSSCPDGYNDASLLAFGFDIPVCLGDLVQRVTAVDHRSELAGLDNLPEEDQIRGLVTGRSQACGGEE